MQNEQQNLKTLCTIIDPEPPSDEGQETQYEVGMGYADQYDLLEVHTYFGEDEFMNIFNSSINNIRKQELKIQATLCNALIDKLWDIYEFVFPENIPLYNQDEIDKVYELVEFLQYNNLIFITNIWKAFNINNILKIDVVKFFTENKDNYQKLLEQITNMSIIFRKDSLISSFLNICNKDTVLIMIVHMTKKWKVEITANLMRG